jgi:hypothetical protein
MNEKLLAYARLISIAAATNKLDAENAISFCAHAVPQLLAELEVLSRVNQRFESALQIVVPPEPKPCEATICSDRWSGADREPLAKPAKKVRKTRKKKSRAK